MNARLTVRPAASADAQTLSVLLDELGYPTDPSQATTRLARLATDPRAIALVACDGDTVSGLATVHAHDNLNREEPSVQLTLLVTASGVRGSGVGRALVAAAERWAEQQGARRLVVTTAVHRAGAHAFYERLGYTLTGRRYTRTW